MLNRMRRRKSGDWEVNKGIAEGILRDRGQRRKALSWFAFTMLGMFAFGLWGVDGWLRESALRFGLYWIACAGLCLFVLLFALLDVLLTFREERDR